MIALGSDVGVASVGDGQDGGAELLAAGGAEIQVVSVVVVDGGLRQHGVVLELGLLDGLAVVRDDDELALAGAEGGERLVGAQAVLAGLHDHLDLGVDGINLGLGLLSHFLQPELVTKEKRKFDMNKLLQ
jgi:hypothetical protein